MRQKSVFRVYLRLAVVITTCVHALVTATALCRAGLWGAQKRTTLTGRLGLHVPFFRIVARAAAVPGGAQRR